MKRQMQRQAGSASSVGATFYSFTSFDVMRTPPVTSAHTRQRHVSFVPCVRAPRLHGTERRERTFARDGSLAPLISTLSYYLLVRCLLRPSLMSKRGLLMIQSVQLEKVKSKSGGKRAFHDRVPCKLLLFCLLCRSCFAPQSGMRKRVAASCFHLLLKRCRGS